MRILASILLISLSGCASASPYEANWFPPQAELLDLVEARVARIGHGGIVLGVVETDGSERVVFAGDPGPGARDLGETSVFQIASVTKVFTGTLLAVLADQNAVQLSNPAADYLPGEVSLPTQADRKITLFDLASHRSGLPRDPSNLEPSDPRDPYADYSVQELLDFVAEVELTADIGSQFQYSNVGFALLGIALESAGGAEYEELLRNHVLKPLGMNRTGVELTGPMSEWATSGYWGGQVAPPSSLPAFVAAGGLRSDIRDMLTFLKANVGEPRSQLERAMRGAQGDPAAGVPALGWQRYELDGSTMLWMGGFLGGYRSFIGFDPDREVGLVLLSNSAGQIDDLGGHLLNPAFPLSEDPN